MPGFIDNLSGRRLILASASPRRRELLKNLGLEFTVDPDTGFTEDNHAGLHPYELPGRMSAGKSHGFHRLLEPDEILITADTLVFLDGRVLGKPADVAEAASMLHNLSGRTHRVITGVTLRDTRHEITFSDSTEVTFTPLTDAEIAYYIDNYQPLDKAGAYGVQELIGYIGISRIDGSFYNVMGIPVHRLYKALTEF